MTVTISYAPNNDGRIASQGGTYSTAVNGNGTFNVDTTSPSHGSFGQRLANNYFVYQYFLEFDQTFDTNFTVVDAYFEFTVFKTAGTVKRHLEIREHNWGPTVETQNFRTPSQLKSEPLLAVATTVGDISDESVVRFGDGQGLRSRLDSSGIIKCVAHTDRNRLSRAPSGDEFTRFYTANESGTVKDPRLIYTSVRKTLLNRVLNSQIQLSDGSHVFAESSAIDHSAQPTAIKHRLADGTGETTIYTNNEASRRIGAQCYALVSDDEDNVYYITAFEDDTNQIHVRAFIKGSGYTWSQTGSGFYVNLPWYLDYTNQVVATWHPVGGIAGTIVAIAGHPFTYKGNPNTYALINVDYIRYGTGSILRDSGDAGGAGLLYLSNPPENYNNNSPNTHGTQIDIARSPGSDIEGQVVAASQNATYLIPNYVSVARYTLTSDGAGFAEVRSTNRDSVVIAKITKDADAKCRIFGVSQTGFVTVVADEDAGAGITVCHFNMSEGSRTSNIVLLDVAHLTSNDIPSLPSEGSLARANNWDAVFHEEDNKIWVYYIDVADDQRLMRTGVNLTTGLADLNEIVVNSSVGATGSVNRTIRAHRNGTYGTPALISVANDDAGTHSMIYVTDTLNIAPTAPVLTSKNNFDATGSSVFEWTFTDPDSSDAQTAYQLQIDRVSDGVTVYDSGKTASSTESHTLPAATLTNGNKYRWRVMTWDRLDVASPWSSYDSFETSASGNVVIEDPATDNASGINTDQYEVEWSVTGATQDGYLVEVYRNDTEELVHGSGWVTSTSVTHLITDMVSDVEHRIEVTIRDSLLVESSTAVRLITPKFAAPLQPFVTLTAEPDNARISVEVFNPEPPPSGPVLNTNPYFETDVAGWEGNNGATIAHSTAQAQEGTGSALVTPDGVTTYPSIRTAVTSAISVTVGQTYTFTVWVYAPNGYGSLAARITWRDSGGAEIAFSWGTTTSVAAGEWVELNVTADAPSSSGGAADALVGVVMDSDVAPATTDTFHIDAAEFFVPSDIFQVSENQVFRRSAGTQDSWDRVATVGVNGTFDDYRTAARADYEYMVRGVSPTGSTNSEVRTAGVDFQGVWLHDPQNAAGTIQQFKFGKAARSFFRELTVAEQHYVGRPHPVFDFGEHQADQLAVRVELPHGNGWQDSVAEIQHYSDLRKTVLLRDNRGRVVQGVLSGYAENDETWGTTVSFTMTRAQVWEE